MKVAVIRHHDTDDAGFLSESLLSRGATLSAQNVAEGDPFPDLEGLDAAVVLGANWSVYDREPIAAWIDKELDWLRRADQHGTRVLGVCFGAQAMAAAHGGRVEPAGRLELGWVSLETRRPELVGSGPWFEFHGDRCSAPAGAEIVADNEIGLQAFRLRRNLAVQFHPEVDSVQLRRWLDDGGSAAAIAAGVDPDALVAETKLAETEARGRADQLIGSFLALE